MTAPNNNQAADTDAYMQSTTGSTSFTVNLTPLGGNDSHNPANLSPFDIAAANAFHPAAVKAGNMFNPPASDTFNPATGNTLTAAAGPSKKKRRKNKHKKFPPDNVEQGCAAGYEGSEASAGPDNGGRFAYTDVSKELGKLEAGGVVLPPKPTYTGKSSFDQYHLVKASEHTVARIMEGDGGLAPQNMTSGTTQFSHITYGGSRFGKFSDIRKETGELGSGGVIWPKTGGTGQFYGTNQVLGASRASHARGKVYGVSQASYGFLQPSYGTGQASYGLTQASYSPGQVYGRGQVPYVSFIGSRFSKYEDARKETGELDDAFRGAARVNRFDRFCPSNGFIGQFDGAALTRVKPGAQSIQEDFNSPSAGHTVPSTANHSIGVPIHACFNPQAADFVPLGKTVSQQHGTFNMEKAPDPTSVKAQIEAAKAAQLDAFGRRQTLAKNRPFRERHFEMNTARPSSPAAPAGRLPNVKNNDAVPTPMTQTELKAYSQGVKEENGTMVYFKPSFIEDLFAAWDLPGHNNVGENVAAVEGGEVGCRGGRWCQWG